MTTTYLWRIPDDYPEEFIGEYQRGDSPDRFAFMRGEPFSDATSTPRFKFSGPAAALIGYDVLPNDTMIPLVSPIAAKWFEEHCATDVQLIATDIKASDKPLVGYKLLNILHLVAGVDHNNSSFVFIPGTKQVMKFNSLRLKPDCLSGHCLARLSEFPAFILVTDFVREQFCSKGWRGHWFMPPEAVHP
jgi:hypothetical protein